RASMSAIFVIAGGVHLVRPAIYLPIMPPALPRPLDLIYISGVCEILGGIGLLVPRARPAATYGLIALLIAVFPANVQMALNGFAQSSTPAWVRAALLARLPLQAVLIALVLACAKDPTVYRAAAPTGRDAASTPKS
ncbi:MAG: DoxX family protein, partial [Ktedonobacterales bacterium]